MIQMLHMVNGHAVPGVLRWVPWGVVAVAGWLPYGEAARASYQKS